MNDLLVHLGILFSLLDDLSKSVLFALVVRNLLFIKKDRDEKEIKKIVTESSYKMSVVTKTREDRRYSEIPAHQMYEFQAMCNPELTMKKFLSEQQAHLKREIKYL